MREVVLATNNLGKVTEFQELLKNLNWHLIPQPKIGLASVEETGLTFIENALLKARHAAEATGLPALSDDSGLVVDALNGEPGVYSARYAGENVTMQKHIDKLLQNLINIPEEKRTARFHCALVYLSAAQDSIPIIAQGTWEGRILFSPQGDGGFGYDPVFYVEDHHCSAAELPLGIKNQISHRGRALPKLFNELRERGII